MSYIVNKFMNFKKYFEYKTSHRPPKSDFGAPLHDLTKVYPSDVYKNIYLYASDEFEKQSSLLILKYKDKPDEKVVIYRSVPVGINYINNGDWVTINKNYAIQHSKHATDPQKDQSVISCVVLAKEIHTDGNSLVEWGYNGPKKEDCKVIY